MLTVRSPSVLTVRILDITGMTASGYFDRAAPVRGLVGDEQKAGVRSPRVDASVQGRWFHAQDLDIETRWPAFTPRARTLGIHAILSSSLIARDQPVGALNIYSRTAVAFAPKDQEPAAVFASEASTISTVLGVVPQICAAAE